MTIPTFILVVFAIMLVAIVVLTVKVHRLSKRLDETETCAELAFDMAGHAMALAKQSPFHASY